GRRNRAPGRGAPSWRLPPALIEIPGSPMSCGHPWQPDRYRRRRQRVRLEDHPLTPPAAGTQPLPRTAGRPLAGRERSGWSVIIRDAVMRQNAAVTSLAAGPGAAMRNERLAPPNVNLHFYWVFGQLNIC